MLDKLLKYDLKWCFKPLSVFYLLALFFSVITRIVESMNQSLIIVIIDKLCSGVVIAMLINILINCFMRNWVRFIRNIYKDESYLTHTLPVSKNQIYLSKVLTMIITLLTSFIFIILCIAIVSLNKDTWLVIKSTLEQSSIIFDSSVFDLIFIMTATIFLQFLYIMMSGILGIILGHKSNNLKIVKSIIYGFMIYMGLSFITLGILYVIGLMNSNIMTLFNSMELNSSVLKNVMIIIMFVYVVYNLIIYFVSNKSLKNGVNVE